ncbi:hypothetical protein GOODEAATRI_034553, partial [Goodea atripinnis]
KPTSPPSKTTGPPPLPFSYVFPSLGFISAVVLLLLVLLVRPRSHRGSESVEKEAGENYIMYINIRITEHHQKKQQFSDGKFVSFKLFF